MILFFNLRTLEAKTKNNPKLLVETLQLHFLNKTLPKNARTQAKPLLNMSGNSYIINAAPLFADKTTDIIYKAQYIKLAGRRDYLQYKLYGDTTLDLSYFLDINLDYIKHNPLLTITNNKIKFKYEE